MATLMRMAIIILTCVTPAIAADGAIAKGSTFLLFLFFGFAALIIVFQFIPGLVLFATMLKGLFTRTPEKDDESLSEKNEKK
jgi:hypothetical protein